jgi:hypothetical protein
MNQPDYSSSEAKPSMGGKCNLPLARQSRIVDEGKGSQRADTANRQGGGTCA